jgi:TolA-binding protein
MSNYFTVLLRGDAYKIKYNRKTDVQDKIKKLNDKIERLKGEIIELNKERKTLTIDLLDERQMIIFNNSYNKNLSSEQLESDKKYLKQKELLRKYDDEHGTFIDLV